MHEPPPPPPVLPDFAGGDGIPWPRLVAGIILLALSLLIGDRTVQHQPRPKATPQPVREGAVAAVDLPPLGSATTAPPPAVPSVAEPPVAPPPKASRTAPRPPEAGRQASQRTPSKRAVSPRRHGAAVAVRGSAAPRGRVRTRAQVRREYLRDRAIVAALTGEDSGSAYLMRMAAQREARRRAQ